MVFYSFFSLFFFFPNVRVITIRDDDRRQYFYSPNHTLPRRLLSLLILYIVHKGMSYGYYHSWIPENQLPEQQMDQRQVSHSIPNQYHFVYETNPNACFKKEV